MRGHGWVARGTVGGGPEVNAGVFAACDQNLGLGEVSVGGHSADLAGLTIGSQVHVRTMPVCPPERTRSSLHDNVSWTETRPISPLSIHEEGQHRIE